jgi:CRP/FNR family transcriptional regulator, cyclic AMP receptor protein
MSEVPEQTPDASNKNPRDGMSLSEPMRRQETLAALLTNGWFQDLPKPIMEKMVSLAIQRRYADNETVHYKFDDPACLHGVISGSVKVSSMSSDGRETTFTYYGPGSWFGQIALLDGLSRTHDIRACGETVLVNILHRDFNELLESNPILYKHFALLLCRLVRVSFSILEDSALLSLQARFAKRLTALADTYGVPHAQGTMINLHLPQDDLGMLLNTSRQTINQKLKEWQKLGWVNLHYGKIIIRNPEALQQLANEE